MTDEEQVPKPGWQMRRITGAADFPEHVSITPEALQQAVGEKKMVELVVYENGVRKVIGEAEVRGDVQANIERRGSLDVSATVTVDGYQDLVGPMPPMSAYIEPDEDGVGFSVVLPKELGDSIG